MIYQMKLVIRDEERDITDFIYHCHISHHNDPDLDKMIELHIKVCEEIGNREDLPVEGDLIALTFNSTNHDQFFYDWLFEGAMHNGEIQFIYNEVETADIFRFWDCYCLGLEESMSVGGAPMRITIYLSPGIIKRNNLEAREKIWKVSEITNNQSFDKKQQTDDKSPLYIKDAYWIDENGKKQRELNVEYSVTLYVVIDKYTTGRKVNLIFEDIDKDEVKRTERSGIINQDGIIELTDFKLELINKEENDGNNENTFT